MTNLSTILNAADKAAVIEANFEKLDASNAFGLKFVQTADVTVGNTAVETTLLGAGEGSKNIPADFLAKGSIIRLRLAGTGKNTGAAVSLTLKVKIGGTVMLSIVFTNADLAFDFFELIADLHLRTTGAAGTVKSFGMFVPSDTDGDSLRDSLTDAGATIDTTSANAIDVTGEWSSADADDTLTVTQATIEIVKP